jgi:hypothetical protein
MLRVTALWTGFPGAPGFTNLYFGGSGDTGIDAFDAANRVRSFFSGMTLCFPVSVNIQVQAQVAVVDAASGAQTGEITANPAPANVVGAGTGPFAAPAGACVTWRSPDFVGGRRVRGRTFLVPLAAAAYESDGTLLPARIAEIRSAATTLAFGGTQPPFGVWHRPAKGTQAGGSFHAAPSATVSDRVAMLQSRQR